MEPEYAEYQHTHGLDGLDPGHHHYSEGDLAHAYADGQYEGYVEGGHDGFHAGEDYGYMEGELVGQHEGFEDGVFDTLGAMDGYDFYGFGSEGLSEFDFYTPPTGIMESTALVATFT
ncbi:hypothetical protein BT69DRAFT_452352 [Atractiella rhizophila]|nr:hypothetical protein BT69DRAFT_452352 [Atractiella rhizophila]